MYKCDDCKRMFNETKKYSDDCTPGGAFEGGSFVQKYDGCPYCESTNYWQLKECCKCEFYGVEKNGCYTSEGFVCEDCLVEEE